MNLQIAFSNFWSPRRGSLSSEDSWCLSPWLSWPPSCCSPWPAWPASAPPPAAPRPQCSSDQTACGPTLLSLNLWKIKGNYSLFNCKTHYKTLSIKMDDHRRFCQVFTEISRRCLDTLILIVRVFIWDISFGLFPFFLSFPFWKLPSICLACLSDIWNCDWISSLCPISSWISFILRLLETNSHSDMDDGWPIYVPDSELLPVSDLPSVSDLSLSASSSNPLHSFYLKTLKRRLFQKPL